jgi:hypothetical protein
VNYDQLVKAGKATPDEVARLANEARMIGGDPAKRGLGRVPETRLKNADTFGEKFAQSIVGLRRASGFNMTTMTQVVPYQNVINQGLSRYIENLMFRGGKQSLVTGLGTLMGFTVPILAANYITSMMSQQTGVRYDLFWNDQPLSVKLNYAYMPVPGERPEDGIFIRLAPEHGILGVTFMAGVDTIFGLSNGTFHEPYNEELKTALSQVLSPVLPSFITAPLALGGIKTNTDFGSARGMGFSQIKPTDIVASEGGFNEGAIPDSAMPRNVEEMIMSLTGALMRPIIGAADAISATNDPSKLLDNVKKQAEFDVGMMASKSPLNPIWGQSRSYAGIDDNAERSVKAQAVDKLNRVYTQAFLNQNPSQARHVQQPTNPKFFEAMQILRGHPELQMLNEARGEYKKNVDSLSAIRPMDRETQIKVTNARAQLNAVVKKQIAVYEEIERYLGVPIEEINPYN